VGQDADGARITGKPCLPNAMHHGRSFGSIVGTFTSAVSIGTLWMLLFICLRRYDASRHWPLQALAYSEGVLVFTPCF